MIDPHSRATYEHHAEHHSEAVGAVELEEAAAEPCQLRCPEHLDNSQKAKNLCELNNPNQFQARPRGVSRGRGADHRKAQPISCHEYDVRHQPCSKIALENAGATQNKITVEIIASDEGEAKVKGPICRGNTCEGGKDARNRHFPRKNDWDRRQVIPQDEHPQHIEGDIHQTARVSQGGDERPRGSLRLLKAQVREPLRLYARV
mmetsp:Transcript_41722/g.106283  ORF Transcript_41722/g.106283 Transcript_41722/m.106283 type:complete len:204 (+) Transcript_41722:156-767(+)